jgi:hypothetical protein
MRILISALALALALSAPALAQSPADWLGEFPNTDFSRSNVPFDEIIFDGARRDSIPPIHDPRFARLAELTNVGPLEPVISLIIDGEARAYPLAILLWHEIVNDTVGGVPVLVSYCPLCNSGVVFDRRVGDQALDFGNTGRIRRFDMVMYDRQTESWWQQFSGGSIVGELTGTKMKLIPSRLESLDQFRARAPNGLVLVPNDPHARPYGTTPYAGMARGNFPEADFIHGLPDDIRALDYAVIIGKKAWPLARLMNEKRIEEEGYLLTWQAGRNSIHDSTRISDGRDLGNVVVRDLDDPDTEIPHDVAFAFAFSAFVANGEWMAAGE